MDELPQLPIADFVSIFRCYTRSMLKGVDQGAAAVGVLDDELRRQLYLIVRRAGQALSRDDVAGQAGISRRLAAFHLDKLTERGLLRAHYARPPGRSGPGAGRSAKYYEPSDLEVDVSIPERRYDLAGRLLIGAIKAESPEEPASTTASRVAREAGAEVGGQVRQEKRLRHPGAERALATAANVLEEHGFEPYRPGPASVALRNCPFRELAQEAPEIICRMNQAFVDGLLRGLGNHTVRAVQESIPGDCCVTLRRA
jgi:predicted ArsR family transcriptional regulator